MCVTKTENEDEDNVCRAGFGDSLKVGRRESDHLSVKMSCGGSVWQRAGEPFNRKSVPQHDKNVGRKQSNTRGDWCLRRECSSGMVPVFPNQQKEIEEGDLTRGGVITYGEYTWLGAVTTSLSPFLLDLVTDAERK